MGMLERLGKLLQSYLAEDDFQNDSMASGSAKYRGDARADPNLKAAYEELDDYLNGGKTTSRERFSEAASQSYTENKNRSQYTHRYQSSTKQDARNIPEALRPDFAELEVQFGASADVCKAAFKKLLMTHHPDKHSGNEVEMQKATIKAARINAAFERITKWRNTI
ncbi:MAG: hypothetical protein Ta2B_24750 [Termitinemataceae bacterium]|nr:MAG: hypothetical protein Ta2B_24750 [Termitinemataceae bacterium]